MLSHIRLASGCLRSCSRPSHVSSYKGLSTTSRRRYSLKEAVLQEEEQVASNEMLAKLEQSSDEATASPETYNDFVDMIGFQYKNADGPRKWLGGEVPFPMNPSFKPPPPVSDSIRTAIYDEFMADPETNSVRAISQRYHLSLKRVDAILRLKGMEKSWVKGKTLQTGFLKGMEKILGVPKTSEALPHDSTTRHDAHEADTLEEEERRDAARQRYQRLYWESVTEDGREPIVPGSLEHAKMMARRYAQADEAFKSNEKFMPRVKDTKVIKTPKGKVLLVQKPNQPSGTGIKFVDVGGKFIDTNERFRRMGEADRRSSKRSVKRRSN